MDANLTMQNNLNEEEPAAYFQRVYKLNRLDASKNEHTYMKLIECGGKISMDDYMELVGRQKPDARTEPALHKHIVSKAKRTVCLHNRHCNWDDGKGGCRNKKTCEWQKQTDC